MSLREFFGFGGYTRPAEGYLSPQHLIFVTSLVIVMILCAVLLGLCNKSRSGREKNLPLVVSALLIDGLELFKIVLLCFRHADPLHWIYELPLFLCSIQLIAIPMAAFCKGRLKEASLDFVAIFGLLGAIMGTYFAGNNYAAYPVLSFDNVVSGLTHCISGFAALYILISGLAGMKPRNIPVTAGILSGFCGCAYVANLLVDYNYMFLMRGDGTPYDILFNLLKGNPVLYPLAVVLLFFIYIAAYYGVFRWIRSRKK